MTVTVQDLISLRDPPGIFTALRYDLQIIQPKEVIQKDPASPCYLSELHRTRLLLAAQTLQWHSILGREYFHNTRVFENLIYTTVQRYYNDHEDHVAINAPLKVRILIQNPALSTDPGVDMPRPQIDVTPVSKTSLTALFPIDLSLSTHRRLAQDLKYQVVLDYLPTDVSPLTYLKTTRREHYDAARQRMLDMMKHTCTTNDLVPVNCEILLTNPAGEITEGSITNVYFCRNGKWITPPVGAIHGGLPGTARSWALDRALCTEQVVRKSEVEIGEAIWLSNGVRGFIPGEIICTSSLNGSSIVQV